MVSAEETKNIALSLEDTEGHRHFNRIAFTVKKKIFATLPLMITRSILNSRHRFSLYFAHPTVM